MNIPIPLIPHKHTRFSESLLLLAGFVRTHLLDRPQTLDELWTRLHSLRKEHLWLDEVSFSGLMLAVDVLFAIGEIDGAKDEYISLRNSTSAPD